MEPIKDTEKIKRMFLYGYPNLVDAQTGYKYSMVAPCPKDNNYSSMIRIERSGQYISRVIFRCASCFTEFEADQSNIYLR